MPLHQVAAARARVGLFRWTTVLLVFAQSPSTSALADAEASYPARPPIVTPVYDQPRPSYDAPKIELGSFLLAPSFSEMLSGDDNIFATDRNRSGDLIVTTSENLNIQSQWSNDNMTMRAYHAHDWYTGHDAENGNVYGIEGDFLLEVAEGSALTLHVGLIQKPQLRNSAQADRQSRSRPVYNTIPTVVSYSQDWRRWHNLLQADRTQTAYIPRADVSRSATRTRYQDRLSYALTGDAWSFLQISYSTQDWRQNPDRRNFDTLRASAGLNMQISELVALEVSAGLIRQHYDFSSFDDLVTPAFSGDLTWNILPLTSLLASVNRTITGLETFCGTISASSACAALPRSALSSLANQRGTLEISSAEIGVQHEFWHDLLGQAHFRFEEDKFNPLGLVDRNYAVDMGARILVNRNMEMDVSYQLGIRTANQNILLYNSGPYQADTVSLTLKAAM